MILTFVLAASFPFQLRKIGIERNVLLHFKSIILVLNFVSLQTHNFWYASPTLLPTELQGQVSSSKFKLFFSFPSVESALRVA